MSRVVVWFVLSCKRCLKKGMFPFLLVLMPAAAFFAGRLSHKEEEKIPVAVSVSGEGERSEDSLAWQLAECLADRTEGLFDFYICPDESQVRDEVASRRAECGYVIDSGLQEKLDQKQRKRVISLYISPATVAGSISTETVFAALASLYDKELLMDYVKEGEAFLDLGEANDSTRIRAAEEAGEIYNRWNGSSGLFHFQYVYEKNKNPEWRGGTGEEEKHTSGYIFSVRGLAAVTVFVMSLYGGVMAEEDERRGLFVPLAAKLRLPCQMAVVAAPAALACLSAFGALFFGGVWESVTISTLGNELYRLLMYGLGCAVFSFILKQIVSSPGILCSMIPFFIIGSLLFCPVFTDAGKWIPGVDRAGRLFLPWYYLKCF